METPSHCLRYFSSFLSNNIKICGTPRKPTKVCPALLFCSDPFMLWSMSVGYFRILWSGQKQDPMIYSLTIQVKNLCTGQFFSWFTHPFFSELWVLTTFGRDPWLRACTESQPIHLQCVLQLTETKDSSFTKLPYFQKNKRIGAVESIQFCEHMDMTPPSVQSM